MGGETARPVAASHTRAVVSKLHVETYRPAFPTFWMYPHSVFVLDR